MVFVFTPGDAALTVSVVRLEGRLDVSDTALSLTVDETGDVASVVLAGDSEVSLRGPTAGLVLLLADPVIASATSVTKLTPSTKDVNVQIDKTVDSAALRVGEALALDNAATGIDVNIADGNLDVTMTQLDGTVRWDATGTLRVDETGEAAAMSVDCVAEVTGVARGFESTSTAGTTTVTFAGLAGEFAADTACTDGKTSSVVPSSAKGDDADDTTQHRVVLVAGEVTGDITWHLQTADIAVSKTRDGTVDVDGLCRIDGDATGLRVVKGDGVEDVVAETLDGALTLVGADANVTVGACGTDAQINVAAGRTTLHSVCDGTLVASEKTAVVVDGTVTVQSASFFSLTGAGVTTVRVSGALVDFVDFTGFVHGVAGTSLAYTTDAASRVIVLGDGCRMSFASETDASGTVAFDDPEGACVGCCAAH